MKKLSLLALAAAGLLLGACSDKNEVAQEVQNPVETEDGAFIGISIQLPNTTAITRANEDFDDGDAKEWEVKDANLLIFKEDKTNDEDAVPTYLATYTLETPVLDSPVNDNVTATINKATRIDNATASEITSNKTNNKIKYYAYVVLNANGMIPELTKDVTTFANFSNLKFTVIGSPIAAECNIGEGGLLMTNAPVCNYPGGAAAPTKSDASDPDVAYTTLVEIAKDKIFSSAALAQKAGNQAACVYVERAAVKITVAEKEGGTTNHTGLGDFTINGWQIVNYNTKFFNTRHVEASWGELASDASGLASPYLYRFVSPTAFAPTVPSAHTGPYRTYFAKDVNYDDTSIGVTGAETLTKPQADYSTSATWIALGKSGYTTENTFDVKNQTWQNTTQITVKVTFNGGTGFFRVDGNDGLLNATQAATQLETNIKSLLSVQNKFQELVQKLPALTGTNVYTLNVIVSNLSTAAASTDASYDVSYTINNGTSDVDLTDASISTEVTALTAAITAGKTTYKASYYSAGVAYYNARIQHFGEVETPWSAAAPWRVIDPGTNVYQIYGYGNTDTSIESGADNSAKRFLGRYGVVRDNWYKLTIDDISELGSAVPINLTGNTTPDDDVKNYMSVHVHIMPWVLRTQSVNF